MSHTWKRSSLFVPLSFSRTQATLRLRFSGLREISKPHVYISVQPVLTMSLTPYCPLSFRPDGVDKFSQ